MEIIRRSAASGRVHKWELPVTDEKLNRWQNGGLAQDVFPHLTSEQREFIVSGITPEEWNEVFPPEEEE